MLSPLSIPAIIFVENQIASQPLNYLSTQLFVTEIIDLPTFSARVAADPNYPLETHINQQRIIVLLDLHDQTNRIYADIVLVLKNGLVSVLCSNYGPPGITLSVDQVYINALIFLDKPPCPPHWCRPNIYDLFKGHPPEAYNRDYNPNRKDPPFNPEPVDE